MVNVKNFKTVDEFENFIEQIVDKEIGDGSEGVCYTSKVDDEVYKIFRDLDTIEVNKILTTDTIINGISLGSIDSFVFPNEIYTFNNKVIGYRTKKVVNGEQFNPNNIEEKILKIAVSKFKNDLILISKFRIRTIDMGANLLFDGKNIFAIDTFNYEISNTNTEAKNLKSFEAALKNEIFPEELEIGFEDSMYQIDHNDPLLQKILELDKKLNFPHQFSLDKPKEKILWKNNSDLDI